MAGLLGDAISTPWGNAMLGFATGPSIYGPQYQSPGAQTIYGLADRLHQEQTLALQAQGQQQEYGLAQERLGLAQQQVAQQRQAQDRQLLLTGMATLGDLVKSDVPDAFKDVAIGKIGESIGLGKEWIAPMKRMRADEQAAMADFLQGFVKDNPHINASAVARIFQRNPLEAIKALVELSKQQAATATGQALQRLQPGASLSPMGSPMPPATTTSPHNAAPFYAMADALGQQVGASPQDIAVVKAMMGPESSFQVDAESPKGARGLLQFMPATAQRYGIDPVQPGQAIAGAFRYLRDIKRALSDAGLPTDDPRLLFASWNAGEGAVTRAQGIPNIPETQQFVQRAHAAYGRLMGGAPHASGMAPLEPRAAVPQEDVGRLNQELTGLRAARMQLLATPGINPADPQVNTFLDNLRSQESLLLQERDRMLTRQQQERTYQAEQPQRALQQEKTRLDIEKARREARGDYTPGDQTKLAIDLRQQVRQEPAFQTAEVAQTALVNLTEGRALDNGVGDLAIAYGAAALFDPRPSVVREGEFDRIETAQGVLQKIFNLPLRFFQGDRLREGVRQAFLDIGLGIANGRLKQAETTLLGIYGPLASRAGIPLEQVYRARLAPGVDAVEDPRQIGLLREALRKRLEAIDQKASQTDGASPSAADKATADAILKRAREK